MHFLLPTKYYYQISQKKYHDGFFLLTKIHAYAEKGPKCSKIGGKLSVKLTAQMQDGFKN